MLDRHIPKMLLTLLCVGAILRLVNIAWGAPFFFHPDERNIASSVSGLSFPDQLNPHFFAYGSLPIYLTFVIGLIKNIFITTDSSAKVSFDDAIIILRLLSATLSIATIYLVYKIGELIKNKRVGIASAFLCTLSVGLIQYSHFGTFETWLTFFSSLLLLGVIRYFHMPSRGSLLLIALSLGTLVSVKISSATYLPILGALYLRKHFSFHKKILTSIALTSFIALSYIVTNPFAYIDSTSFLNSINYESSVALGKMLVFYTGEFITALPIIFPMTKIYPFLLNPVIAVLSPFALIFVVLGRRKRPSLQVIYLLIFLLATFASQTFLFAQWTRYFVPTLPLIYLCIGLAGDDLYRRNPSLKKYLHALSLIIVASCILFCFAFIKTSFLDKDTRIQALNFATRTIPNTSQILSEVYDLGITPFNQAYPFITLFNFYDLDNNTPESTVEKYRELLARSDYLILPSQRLYKTRLGDRENFPVGNSVYMEIQDSKQFEKIYQTPCDLWCSLTYLGDPIFRFEQTVNIFDRPSVMIYRIHHEK